MVPVAFENVKKKYIASFGHPLQGLELGSIEKWVLNLLGNPDLKK